MSGSTPAMERHQGFMAAISKFPDIKLIDKADRLSVDEIAEMGRRAKKRVAEEYTWEKICGLYEEAFLR